MIGKTTKQMQPNNRPLAPWSKPEERLWAQLALALTRPAEVGPCLDDETLLAFHEGRLSKNEEAKVREHVAACADCYDRWLEARDWVPQPTLISLLARIKEFFLSGAAPRRKVWFGAAGVLATACLILTFTFLYFQPSGLVLDEWAAAELRGLVRIAPGGVVPKPPAGAAVSPRIRGFPLADFPLTGEDLAAFTSGIRLAAVKLAGIEPSWQAVVERLSELPASSQGTGAPGRWQDGRELLVALGYWSALVAVACETASSEDEVVRQSYLLARQRQLERLWTLVQASSLSPEVQKTVATWVQEATASQGRDLCRLQPVVFARELVGDPRS